MSADLENGNIVIGYRGGYLASRYGRLGYDKHEIGRRVASSRATPSRTTLK